jgi:hypothetical protein
MFERLIGSLRERAIETAKAGNRRFWVLLLVSLGCAVVVSRPPPRAPALRLSGGPIRQAGRCPVPVERPGDGVVCLSADAAARLGLDAGEVWLTGPSGERLSGPPRRMAPERRLAAGVPLDPETASAAELEALPDVGPQLARRMIEARLHRPLRSRSALLSVPGVGPHRLARIAPFLIPLP